MSLLVIDVGNTETKLGLFASRADGTLGDLTRTWHVTTAMQRTSDEFGVLFSALFRHAEIPLGSVRSIVVASVVPQNDRSLREACERYFETTPEFFTAATQHLIDVTTDRPKELGADLVAAAAAAKAIVGTPTIVIGFGTATTFGAISRTGEYLGAAIAPGIQISIDALVARTAKLPHVALHAPAKAIGRDTVSALQSGIVFGFVGQTEGIVARMREEIGADAHVIATGGLADIIARHTTVIGTVEPNLVLLGLRLHFDRADGR